MARHALAEVLDGALPERDEPVRELRPPARPLDEDAAPIIDHRAPLPRKKQRASGTDADPVRVLAVLKEHRSITETEVAFRAGLTLDAAKNALFILARGRLATTTYRHGRRRWWAT